MSESEEAFESADEDVEELKGKKRGRTASEKLGKIKETESPVRDSKDRGDGLASEAASATKGAADDGVTEKTSVAEGDSDAKAEPKKDAAETPAKEKEMSVLERLAHAASRDEGSSINWGFGKWGSSILSTAATSVSTFTNQVSQGIGTVIETVESTLGAPSPEELAQADKASVEADPGQAAGDADASKAAQSEDKPDGSGVGGILSGVTAFTKAIEATGSKVLSGGLDTLEMIGKKTMDILTEGDPGLRKKRAMFEGKTSLSEVLREAKMKAEKEAEERKAEEADDAVNYSKLFDEHQGLVHLEALEMLCGERKTAVQQKMMEAGEQEKAELTPSSTKSRGPARACQRQTTPQEIYRRGIETLAEMTAKTMELYHKVAELLLVKTSPDRTPMHYATQLTGSVLRSLRAHLLFRAAKTVAGWSH
ncbi:hypothetical protein HPB48_004930 [Haemaphysalis longicornis]|uniref:Family with sequence similarity 114 member A2 n=1 Tax=Haemaphysalis longicornis TaxID=44386 RepID=A0A9J6GED9_HAELO|nr:hypothetical protein HPB48_004930 [Haemaphysalis longicornis]